MTNRCARKEELIVEVQRHLDRLSDLARKESQLIGAEDEEAWMAVDREIEIELGAKERCLGALKEHREKHGC
jgi:hypothetical protein